MKKVFVFALVLIVLVGVGYYFFNTMQGNNVYSNDEFGFTFEYPENLTLKEENSPAWGFSAVFSNETDSQAPIASDAEEISIYINKDTPVDITTKTITRKGPIERSVEQISIGDRKGIIFEDRYEGPWSSKVVQLPLGNDLFQITFSSIDSNGLSSNNAEI